MRAAARDPRFTSYFQLRSVLCAVHEHAALCHETLSCRVEHAHSVDMYYTGLRSGANRNRGNGGAGMGAGEGG